MTDSTKRLGALERSLKRERAARKRSEELLESKSRELYTANKQLEDAYSATVEVFANLVGGRGGRSSESMRAMGHDAVALAKKMGLDGQAAQNVYLASLLCDLGKLTIPDRLIELAYVELSKAQRDIFHNHPQLAYEALLGMQPLERVAEIVLCHCELANGEGYPRRLSWDEIALEAKIVCVTKDFDGLQRGKILDAKLTDSEAKQYLVTHRSDRYSPEIVDEFLAVHAEKVTDTTADIEKRLTPQALTAGMIITRDIVNESGVLILPAGRVLHDETIERLRKLVASTSRDMLVYVISAQDAKRRAEQAALDGAPEELDSEDNPIHS